MNGPFADEYWKAAKEEISTLEGIDAWDIAEHENIINIIDGT